MTNPDRVPVTINGVQVGWATILDDGTFEADITDEGTLDLLTQGTLGDISIED